MESTGVDKIVRDDEAEGSETTIEIKIKTLDSQTYTLRVNKQMPVPVLKEQIASVTGVLSEQQRLICRGKVLKDDQLLSAYHVEDGHTLHLVVRQPVPAASEGLSNHPADPVSSASRGEDNRVAPSVVIETFNVPDQADGVPPEISRIVSAVLGSFGISGIGSGSEGIFVREHGSERLARTPGADSTPLQPEQASMRVQSDRPHGAFGLPTAISLGPLQPPVIPDSLTTLSHYMTHMRHEFGANGRGGGNNTEATGIRRTQERESNPTSHAGTIREALPTPASLAEVMLSTRQLLIEQAGEHLLQLERQLESQANVTDPSLRLSTQSSAWRSGVLFQNLGAFLLELGRATMTLRMGQTPSEAIVNAGPAVFISPSGPNPLMVQPLPFQPGASFGLIPTGTVQPSSGLFSGLGTGLRHIDIQIRRGSSTATPNVNQEERGNSQQPSEQRNPATVSGGENVVYQATSGVPEGPSFTAQPGVRVVPIRTMVAAGPFSRLPADSSSSSLGVYYPVLGRFQHVASGQVTDRRGSQASGENYPSGFQTEQQPIPESALQQQNLEDPAGAASLPTPNLRQRESPHSRSFNISVLSSGGTQNNQESEREIPSSVVQFLRTLFPGGEIHVDNAGIQGTATGSVAEQEGIASAAVDAQEAGVTDEGIFLSNLLHQIMPIISQNAEQSNEHPEVLIASEHRTAQDSSTQTENSDVGTSRRESSCTDPPNSKRQKRE